MILLRTCLLIALVLAAPNVCTAQSPLGQVPWDANQGQLPSSPKKLVPKQLERMYEDVEVLRRLLNRQLALIQTSNCTSCHGAAFADFDHDGRLDLFITNSPGSTQGWQLGYFSQDFGTHHNFESGGHVLLPEGVYLPGKGVVYQAILPAQLQNIHGIPRLPKAQEMSDWEKIRKEVRGEKVEPVSAKGMHHFRLEDALLKVLADNGHNFSHLDPSESITIAITFRSAEPGKGAMGNKAGGMMSPGGTGPSAGGGMMAPGGSGIFPGAGGGPQGAGMGGNLPVFGGGQPSSTMQGPGGGLSSGGGLMGPGGGIKLSNPGMGGLPGSQGTDLELLGDMYFKQGHYKSAIMAFEKALRQKPEKKLYRKLALCYLKDSTSSDDMIQKAIEFLKKSQDPLAVKDTPPKNSLPARLIVSVSKRVLDLAGSNRWSLEELRKKASIEWLRFPLAEGKKEALLPAGSPDIIRVKGDLQRLRIPINVQPNGRKQLESIRLLVSRDHGKTWKLAQTAAPTEDSIELNTPTDGEFWLGLQLIHKNGTIEPAQPDNVQPSLKIFVEKSD